MGKIRRLAKQLVMRNNFSSRKFWETRYDLEGNSGAGSYGEFAEFKAEVLNKFVEENKIKIVLEFGCGDGNQLKLFKFPNYIGFDISRRSIETCNEIFGEDASKSFFLYDSEYFFDNHQIFMVDLTLSLDVIYHLVEDRVFEKYMRDLFSTSDKYVIIYASNKDEQEKGQAEHVRHRKFTAWVDENQTAWKLEKHIENRYPYNEKTKEGSFADFYIFKKR